MSGSPIAVIIDIALLAAFLISVVVAKYAFSENFARTRFIMSALFLYIVISLTNSYWHYALITLPYTLPAFFGGAFLGHVVGVRTEQQKITMQGIERYMERFAEIKREDVQQFTWWSFINFYSITAALILINLIGFTSVLMDGSPLLIILTSVIGASLIGSIVPYLVHLWLLPYRREFKEAR